MKQFLLRGMFCTLVAAVASSPVVLASHDFTQTGAGTFDSNANGNWSGGVPTGDGQDVNFSQSISSGNQSVTNLFSANRCGLLMWRGCD